MHFLLMMFWLFVGGVGPNRSSAVTPASAHSLQAMDGGIFPPMKPNK
jgi:hypothetical protein